MSDPKRLSEILKDWAEIDAALTRVTGKSYEDHRPNWRAEEGPGLDAAAQFLREHRETMTPTERSRLKQWLAEADVPGARSVSTTRVRRLADAAQSRLRHRTKAENARATADRIAP